jgi:hypothetical protein
MKAKKFGISAIFFIFGDSLKSLFLKGDGLGTKSSKYTKRHQDHPGQKPPF